MLYYPLSVPLPHRLGGYLSDNICEYLFCTHRVLQSGGRAVMSKASTGQSLMMVEHHGALSRLLCLPQMACQPGALYYIQM